MRSFTPNVALCIWLTLSGSIWLFGLLWIGELYLPRINGYNSFLLYLPWLILIGMAIRLSLAKALRRE